MSYAENNRHWLKLFINDILNSKDNNLELYGAFAIETDVFCANILDDKKGKFDKEHILEKLKQYDSLSSGYIIRMRDTVGHDINDVKRELFRLLMKLDSHNKLDLLKIKFDLVRLDTNRFAFARKHYLLVCDIQENIDFELIYGTLKVMAVI